jgi:hypothetical protein
VISPGPSRPSTPLCAVVPAARRWAMRAARTGSVGSVLASVNLSSAVDAFESRCLASSVELNRRYRIAIYARRRAGWRNVVGGNDIVAFVVMGTNAPKSRRPRATFHKRCVRYFPEHNAVRLIGHRDVRTQQFEDRHGRSLPSHHPRTDCHGGGVRN